MKYFYLRCAILVLLIGLAVRALIRQVTKMRRRKNRERLPEGRLLYTVLEREDGSKRITLFGKDEKTLYLTKVQALQLAQILTDPMAAIEATADEYSRAEKPK